MKRNKVIVLLILFLSLNQLLSAEEVDGRTKVMTLLGIDTSIIIDIEDISVKNNLYVEKQFKSLSSLSNGKQVFSYKIDGEEMSKQSAYKGRKIDSVIIHLGDSLKQLLKVEFYSGWQDSDSNLFTNRISKGFSTIETDITLPNYMPQTTIDDIYQKISLNNTEYYKMEAIFINCQYKKGGIPLWVSEKEPIKDTWLIVLWKKGNMFRKGNNIKFIERYLIDDSTGQIGRKGQTIKN